MKDNTFTKINIVNNRPAPNTIDNTPNNPPPKKNLTKLIGRNPYPGTRPINEHIPATATLYNSYFCSIQVVSLFGNHFYFGYSTFALYTLQACVSLLIFDIIITHSGLFYEVKYRRNLIRSPRRPMHKINVLLLLTNTHG